MYDFPCEHCDGRVRERRVDREALRHKGNFVILEDVPIGVCDKCGARYFDASVLRRVAEIGRGTTPAQRTIAVPVDQYVTGAMGAPGARPKSCKGVGSPYGPKKD